MIDIYSGSRTAIIIEDMSDSNEQHNSHNMLSCFGYSGRHHNFSLFILSQKLNSISIGIRDNATIVVFTKMHNKRSLKISREEFFQYIEDDAKRMLLDKLNKNKYIDMKVNEGVYLIW